MTLVKVLDMCDLGDMIAVYETSGIEGNPNCIFKETRFDEINFVKLEYYFDRKVEMVLIEFKSENTKYTVTLI